VYLDVGHKKGEGSDQCSSSDKKQTATATAAVSSSKISRTNPSERIQLQLMETVLEIRTKTNP